VADGEELKHPSDKTGISVRVERNRQFTTGFAGERLLDVENAELSAIYIHPDAVGKGIGSKLLNELEKIVRNNGIFKITVYSTVNAKDFSMARGYSKQ